MPRTLNTNLRGERGEGGAASSVFRDMVGQSADTAGEALYNAIKETVENGAPAEDTFYMPTFGVGPDELEDMADEIWTIKYADLLG